MHEAPTDEVFEEMKQAATKIWSGCDNEFGYVDEKMDRINARVNIQDNAMVFYREFDHINQAKMREGLSDEALNYIRKNP